MKTNKERNAIIDRARELMRRHSNPMLGVDRISEATNFIADGLKELIQVANINNNPDVLVKYKDKDGEPVSCTFVGSAVEHADDAKLLIIDIGVLMDIDNSVIDRAALGDDEVAVTVAAGAAIIGTDERGQPTPDREPADACCKVEGVYAFPQEHDSYHHSDCPNSKEQS